ncbi:MAG: class I SAM-dependent methyltransferase [Myxococcota bacterium]
MDEPKVMFENRLRKNARHRHKWARRSGLSAYRLYDRDLPEYPFAIDWYDGRVHLVEYPRRKALRTGDAVLLRSEVLQAVQAVLDVPPERIYTKTHLPQPWGRTQYERQAEGSERFVVEEQGQKFWVNLGDYLDTGLFLDHRLTRARVRAEANGRRFLNLFAYTGSFSVYAAAGGARSTTTVDLSNTYCAWAENNLALNGVGGAHHRVVRADVRAWLRQAAARRERFDLVVLDPPSFSTSKKMTGTFDVQRDHPQLIADTLALLVAGGVLYFSTNFQGFHLDERAVAGLSVEELTPRSIPEDFRPGIHRCWRLVLPLPVGEGKGEGTPAC